MGCFTFAKVVMVLFNLLILVSGLTLLVMAIWASVDGASHLQILGPFSSQSMQHVNVAHFYMAIGALLVLLAFLGCCGAHKGSKCLLLTFFSIILIIVIAEVAAAAVALAYSSFVSYPHQRCHSLPPSSLGSFTSKQKPLANAERDHACLVTQSFDSHPAVANDQFFFSQAKRILRAWASPALHKQYAGNAVLTKPCNATMTEGCFEQILQSLTEHANIVGGIAAGIAILEIAALMVSMYLYCHMDKRVS
ncbi:tetraspanin-1 isoform X1 [Syngnathus scovelli]|uniref:tetraspanin-1 isoform X1 n=1 Tax=Syngnathus scovelli TaxID=161590 RepID=UPI0021106C19|nr:tetraspanin-1 isoform X1 [Syngnathus scovelli]